MDTLHSGQHHVTKEDTILPPNVSKSPKLLFCLPKRPNKTLSRSLIIGRVTHDSIPKQNVEKLGRSMSFQCLKGISAKLAKKLSSLGVGLGSKPALETKPSSNPELQIALSIDAHEKQKDEWHVSQEHSKESEHIRRVKILERQLPLKANPMPAKFHSTMKAIFEGRQNPRLADEEIEIMFNALPGTPSPAQERRPQLKQISFNSIKNQQSAQKVFKDPSPKVLTAVNQAGGLKRESDLERRKERHYSDLLKQNLAQEPAINPFLRDRSGAVSNSRAKRQALTFSFIVPTQNFRKPQIGLEPQPNPASPADSRRPALARSRDKRPTAEPKKQRNDDRLSPGGDESISIPKLTPRSSAQDRDSSLRSCLKSPEARRRSGKSVSPKSERKSVSWDKNVKK